MSFFSERLLLNMHFGGGVGYVDNIVGVEEKVTKFEPFCCEEGDKFV